MFSIRKLAKGLWPVAMVAAVSGCEDVAKVQPGSFPTSSRLGISSDGKSLYVALADHGKVQKLDAATGDVQSEIDVDGTPHRLTVLSDGRVAVSARHTGKVHVLDMATNTQVAEVEVGSEPFGLVEADGKIVVAVAGEGVLARIPMSDPDHVEDFIDLEDSDPRGVAVTSSGMLYVTHFTSGKLTKVDPISGTVRNRVDMKLAENPFFFPNQLDSLTVSPTGNEVVAPHVECNNNPGQFGANTGATPASDLAGTVVEYYASGPTGFPAVVPAVSRVDADTGVLVSVGPGEVGAVGFGAPTEEPEGAVSPVINPIDRNLLGETLVNGPVAVALADAGYLELLVNQSSGNVLIRKTRIEKGERSIVGVVEAGVGASSIVLSPDGGRAFVFNEFSHEVTAFDVPLVDHKLRSGGVSVAEEGDKSGQFNPYAAPAPIPEIKPEFVQKIAEPYFSAEIERGRVLFHSVDERLTRNGAISCNSCHPGGGDDATAWEFAEGVRQTPPLWGGLSGTEPFHWDQRVRTIEDISDITIQGRMGGTGLGSQDMNNVLAFLDTIPAPAAPKLATPTSVENGMALFAEMNCTSCHAGADFTDNLSHDVGTGIGTTFPGTTRERRESELKFATPVLHGLAHTAPYLHDGSAKTLEEVVRLIVVNGKMGNVREDGSLIKPNLTDGEIADLVAYLKTL